MTKPNLCHKLGERAAARVRVRVLWLVSAPRTSRGRAETTKIVPWDSLRCAATSDLRRMLFYRGPQTPPPTRRYLLTFSAPLPFMPAGLMAFVPQKKMVVKVPPPPQVPGSFSLMKPSNLITLLSLALEFFQMATFPLQNNPYATTTSGTTTTTTRMSRDHACDL